MRMFCVLKNIDKNININVFLKTFLNITSLTLLRPAFFGSLKPLKMGVMGGRFQKWVGTSYLTKIDARHEDLLLSYLEPPQLMV